MFIIYHDFGSMPTVNVIQIKVYEIYIHFQFYTCFFHVKQHCKTCIASGYKIHKTSEGYKEDIILFMLKCLTFDEKFWK